MSYRGTFLKTSLTLAAMFVLAGCGCSESSVRDSSKSAPRGGGVTAPNSAPTISQSCASTASQGTSYSCSPAVTDANAGDSHSWSLDAANTCSWLTVSTTTGALSGTPHDDQVGGCTLAFKVNDGTDSSAVASVGMTVLNVAPTLSISDATLATGSALTLIRSDADVQSSDEGYGTYAFDDPGTTAPKCSANAQALSINASTGAISFDPNNAYSGVCNIKVVFDDGNATNNTVSSEFAVTVTSAPIINSVTKPADATYVKDDTLDFTLNYSVNVDVVTTGGTPRLTLTVGGVTAYASYVSGTGSAALIFRYTVAGGHYDADGIALASPVDLNGGTINEAGGTTNASLTLSSPTLTAVLVDADTPVITAAACAATVNQDASYSCSPTATDPDGESLTWSLDSTNDCAWVSIVGSTGVISGSPNDDQVGTCTLAFKVSDGTYTSPVNSRTVTVNNIAPTLAISNASSISKEAGATVIRADGDVSASEEGYGVYSLDTTTVTASGCHANATALSINASTGAISFDPDGVFAGTCYIKVLFDDQNASSNTVSSEFSIAVVDNPVVSSVTAPANGNYPAGVDVEFTVNFSESVNVNLAGGTPRIALTVGAATLYAGYVSGTGSTALLFRYTVQSGDADADGIASTSPIELNGGTIQDGDTNNADLSFSAIDLSAVTIAQANSAPTISQSCATSGTQDSAYSCSPMATDADVGSTLTWSLDATNTCSWAGIVSGTGAVSGTPDDDEVGTCTLAFKVNDGTVDSAVASVSVTISNLAPTLSIANASALGEDAASTVIRADADVQASDEGFGLYSLDNLGTTAPKCSDNAQALSIDATTGAVTYHPAADYNGTCNIKVSFDDGNASSNTVSAEFSITVNAVNDVPVISQSCATTATESTAYSCSPTKTDPDTGETYTWSFDATNTCSWAGIASGTGAISGTPTSGDVGNCTLAFKVNDGTADSAVASVAITVASAGGGGGTSTFLITGLTGGADTSADEYLTDTSAVTVNWEEYTGTASYDVEIKDVSGTSSVCALQTVTAPASSYAFTGCTLTAGVSYTAFVVADDGSGGISPATNNEFVFDAQDPVPLVIITGVTGGTDNLKDEHLSDGSLATINWKSASGASSFEATIYEADGTTVRCATQPGIAGSATSYSFSSCSLSPGVEYVAEVIALDSANVIHSAINGAYPFNTAVVTASTMCAGGNGLAARATITSASGRIVDSGGTASTYGGSESCYVEIATPGATSVGLSTLSFDSRETGDYLEVHNASAVTVGSPTSATNLIGTYSNGTVGPNNINANAGVMTLYWQTDNARQNAGYELSYKASLRPSAFSISGVTGGADNSLDGYLTDGATATVSWQASVSAASYEVLIRDMNSRKTICPAVQTTASSYNFASCTLSAGVTYSINIVAITSTGYSRAASNDGYLFTVGQIPPGYNYQAYVKASNADPGDYFGTALALSGDTLAVGADRDASNQTTITNGPTASSDNSAASSGAAYVYLRSGTSWAQQAYLKPSNMEAGDYFGQSVDIDGDTIVVGSPREDSGQTTITNGTTASTDNSLADAGAAYIFVRSGTSWTQQSYLKAPNADGLDYFGSEVTISGDTVVVSAPSEGSGNTTITNGSTITESGTAATSGAAYVFVRSGTTWTHQAHLKPANTGSSDKFGRSVDIHGDTIVVGADWEDSSQTTITNGSTSSTDDSATDAGAAYVFVRSGSTWTQQAYLKAPNAESGDKFGGRVTVFGDTVVVAAIGEDSIQNTVTNGDSASSDNTGSNSGAAYVFVRSGTTWTQQAYLKAPNAAVYGGFGGDVSIYQDTLVVGAHYEDSGQAFITNGGTASSDTSATDAGAAFVFKRTGTSWAPISYLKAPNAEASDNFGRRVAIHGATVVAGAYGEDSSDRAITNGTTASADNNASYSGAAYVMVLEE